jgi:hypothetical protein
VAQRAEEIDARMDAHVGSAMEDFAERVIGLCLDYLHPDDVLGIVQSCMLERGGGRDDIPRLHERRTRLDRPRRQHRVLRRALTRQW